MQHYCHMKSHRYKLKRLHNIPEPYKLKTWNSWIKIFELKKHYQSFCTDDALSISTLSRLVNVSNLVTIHTIPSLLSLTHLVASMGVTRLHSEEQEENTEHPTQVSLIIITTPLYILRLLGFLFVLFWFVGFVCSFVGISFSFFSQIIEFPTKTWNAQSWIK